MKSALAFHAGPVPNPSRWRAHAAAVVAKLKDLAPYAALELVLPGGSLMALLLWLYRRHGAALLARRGFGA